MKKNRNTLEEAVIMNKSIMDTFLEREDPIPLIAVYIFYYYTAKWQGTNTAKATNNYVATGLKLSERKVIKIKKKLIDLGFIENIKRINPKTKKISGWYVKVKYVWSRNTIQNQSDVFQHPGNNHTVAQSHTNASSAITINTSNADKQTRRQKSFDKSKRVETFTPEEFEEICEGFGLNQGKKNRGP